MNRKIRSVAILGGGPAASTLATLLARAKISTAIFHQPKRAPLIVGESLVPAVIPMLRELGVEKEIAAYSLFKPGATINLTETVNFSFPFNDIRGPLPRYAYNVPRDKFDDTLLNAARKAGVKIFEMAAGVEKIPGADKIELSEATLAATGNCFNGQPDLIVDATGRVRLLPKLLGIGAREGGRKDAALFAHVDRTQLDYEGHVHTTRLDHGWSWRIPLRDRVSVGMVIGAEHLPKFGATKEEQFDNLLKQDSVLMKVAGGAKRLTPVMEYANYQLVSERLFGENWALVGDTAGFIDPVFSSGLFLGMQGGILLAKAIQNGSANAFKKYQDACIHHLECWQQIADYFYDGSLFNSVVVGERMEMKYPWVKLMSPWYRNHFAKLFTGAASDSNFSIGMLRWVVNYGLKHENPEKLKIH
ncbi:MAG TPA: NAD(P)/FAD-dependent oxidoreductase [Verrucomicrobiae bacterium]|nr:NAD(P)/FAD-dependent oxidoreductase [Verrucomicrobiae bacterium]